MKFENSKNIWLYAEHSDEKLLPFFYELLTRAKLLANEVEGCLVCALVIGSSVLNVVKEAEESGVDIVYYVDDKKLSDYNPETYTVVIEGVINEHKPSAFLFGATAIGSELAPSAAARVKTGLASHCVDITADKNGALTFIVPAFGGQVECDILIPNHRPQMASVRPGILGVDNPVKAPEVQTVRLECPALPDSRISFVSFTPSENIAQNLYAADLVVGCGRGVGTDANFKNLEKLANKLNAAIAFTRPAVDLGWAHDEKGMVGSSGISIKPKLYLGFPAQRII